MHGSRLTSQLARAIRAGSAAPCRTRAVRCGGSMGTGIRRYGRALSGVRAGVRICRDPARRALVVGLRPVPVVEPLWAERHHRARRRAQWCSTDIPLAEVEVQAGTLWKTRTSAWRTRDMEQDTSSPGTVTPSNSAVAAQPRSHPRVPSSDMT